MSVAQLWSDKLSLDQLSQFGDGSSFKHQIERPLENKRCDKGRPSPSNASQDIVENIEIESKHSFTKKTNVVLSLDKMKEDPQ